MKCPCKDCLCAPICRHKIYPEIDKCPLVSTYLCVTNRKTKIEKITEIKESLHPTTWDITRVHKTGRKIVVSKDYIGRINI
jgi:hypothetical protein